MQILRTIVQENRFADGQDIFREGAPGNGVYFIKSGSVKISAGAGERRVFSRRGSGEIFGEMAIIEHWPCSAAASAAGAPEAVFLPRVELLPFIRQSLGPAFALAHW